MLMRFVLVAALVTIAVGVGSKSGLFDVAVPDAGVAVVSADARAPVVLAAGEGGHFFVDAIVKGRTVRFLVDTGATVVVLSEETARRLGIAPKPTDFTATSRTANGTVSVAPVTLSDVRIGTISVRDVEAVVVPDGALETDLLGMSFLKRLRGFQSSGRQMVLTP